MKSEEIKPTDGRKGNKRKKSIPLKPIPERERSNKPAMNYAKKSRKKAYAKKALKTVFGSEVAAFEAAAKKAKETGNYNMYKMLFDYAYEEENTNKKVTNNAPVINFFGNSDVSKKIEDRIIDVTQDSDGEAD
ncbi:MAG: hypothetical protein HRU18_11200 [Pseudoalteromonas sp.]|uniref:hypothetical protein n=1 Tax=Pseudoalteromonas sp. TaxID=53249 RepID=UPI001D37FFBE|nr:hypothetical protein [Pseudoalteromonas sp.]NRA78766.1 hypothetical protein [Pseudoalteromonas sp.]